MTLNFLIGVEGSGHNMMRAVMKSHLERNTVIDEGAWHKPMNTHWNAEKRDVKEKKLSNLFGKKEMRSHLTEVFQSYREQGVTHLFESASFPYNQPRDTLRRPDILEFEELCDGLVDIKYLVLYRSPASAAYSGIRRGFSKNVHLQARLTEDNLIFIERQFSQIDKEAYRTIHFNDFLDTPRPYCEKLSEWWDIKPADLEDGINNLLKPLSASDIPKKAKKILDAFYTDRRANQWNDFFFSNRL